MNKIILIGRLVADLQLRYTQNGTAVGSFTLAVDRDYTPKDKEKETDFIDIVVWGKLAEVCANHIGKGRLVAVCGRLQIRSYDDQNGVRRKAAEVVADQVQFLDYAKDNNGSNGSQRQQANGRGGDSFDDSVPF